ncbi:MAG: hypothetical protein LUG45_00895 [Clostridiales bacterium]|nr:hypothetical protein [Clostridiales bacterium]
MTRIQLPPPMTLRGLLDALADFTEDALKDIQLPVKQEGHDEERFTTRAVKCYKQRMPEPDDAEQRCPYILLQLLNGSDDRDNTTSIQENEAVIRMVISTYDRDREQGSLAVLTIVERLRFLLLKTGVLAERYELLTPLEFQIYPDDTGPYCLAEMNTVWRIPAVERNLPFLRG